MKNSSKNVQMKTLVRKYSSFSSNFDNSAHIQSVDKLSISRNDSSHETSHSQKNIIENNPKYSFQEMKQKQNFDSYSFDPQKEATLREKPVIHTKAKIKKINSTPFICFCGIVKPPSEMNTWWLESESFVFSGRGYSKFQYLMFEENKFEDESYLKKFLKNLKTVSSVISLSSTLKNLKKIMMFLQISENLLFYSKKIQTFSHLSITFGYCEALLWAGPKFILDYIFENRKTYSKDVDNLFEIKGENKRIQDRDINQKDALSLIDMLIKNSMQIKILQSFNIVLCSWSCFSDEILHKISELIILNPEKSQLSGLLLYFSGSKITDKGIESLMGNIKLLKLSNLNTFSIGFDTRNEYTTDSSLILMVDTLLYLSQENFISDVSLCLITKNITNYGVWCVFEGLMKIAHRLENLTLVLGNDNKINTNAFKNFKEFMKKTKNLKKINLGLMSSKLDEKGLFKILRTINTIEGLRHVNIFYSNKGCKSKNIETQVANNLMKWNMNLISKSAQVFLD